MAANVTCPMCGKQCTPTEHASGPDMRCPACFSIFPVKPPAPSPLLARSATVAQAAVPVAVNRTMLAQPEAMIRYSCPRCQKSLESPASFAGQKLNCPDCNQRLQIPPPSKPSPVPTLNKTILAKEEPAAAPSIRTPRPSSPAVPPVPIPTVELVEETVAAPRRESCLECGADITRRARLQTCPECGSLFCSAGCYRDHHYHAHGHKAKKRSRPVECHRCGSTEPPSARTQISQAGWITFVLLLVFFFPLFWIGLLMTETEWRCRDCGARLD